MTVGHMTSPIGSCDGDIMADAAELNEERDGGDETR